MLSVGNAKALAKPSDQRDKLANRSPIGWVASAQGQDAAKPARRPSRRPSQSASLC
jgi:hypothetical protein